MLHDARQMGVSTDKALSCMARVNPNCDPKNPETRKRKPQMNMPCVMERGARCRCDLD